jgi:hypothetical protein
MVVRRLTHGRVIVSGIFAKRPVVVTTDTTDGLRARVWLQGARVARRMPPASVRLAGAARKRATPAATQARTWTAARLDRSSAAVQETLAPRLSSALTATARRVRPPSPPRPGLRGILRAAGLVVAIRPALRRPRKLGKMVRTAGLVGALGLAAGTALAVRNRSASTPSLETSSANEQPDGQPAPDAQSSTVLNPSAEVGR